MLVVIFDDCDVMADEVVAGCGDNNVVDSDCIGLKLETETADDD
jgi:hypothetical protein